MPGLFDLFKSTMVPVCGDGLLLISKEDDDLEDLIMMQYNAWIDFDRPAYVLISVFLADFHETGEVSFGRN